jgi:hypothetical protein
MQTRHVTFGIALLLLTGLVGAADAKTLHVHCKSSGTFADMVGSSSGKRPNGFISQP